MTHRLREHVAVVGAVQRERAHRGVLSIRYFLELQLDSPEPLDDLIVPKMGDFTLARPEPLLENIFCVFAQLGRRLRARF
jgi:hypothetical protein